MKIEVKTDVPHIFETSLDPVITVSESHVSDKTLGETVATVDIVGPDGVSRFWITALILEGKPHVSVTARAPKGRKEAKAKVRGTYERKS